MGRIEMIIKQNGSFERRDTQGLKEVFKYSYGNTGRVKISVSPLAKSEIEEWLGVECMSEKDGVLFAEANLPLDAGLVSKLLGYGNKVKVVYPESLKNMVKEKAEEIFSLYK